MRNRIKSGLTFSNVIAMLALFMAMTGGAYAASKVVTGKTIKNNSVKGADVYEKSLEAVCPKKAPDVVAGTICAGPLQSSPAGVDWDVAARDCAAEKLSLPSTGELMLVTDQFSDPYLWTDEFAAGGNFRVIVRKDDTGGTRIATTDKTTPQPYRCVTTVK